MHTAIATVTCMFNHLLIMHSLYVGTSLFTLPVVSHFTVLISVLNLQIPTAGKET
jgi:hypothetical protein